MIWVGKGLTGWLDPEGVFHPCGYGEHHLFAHKIMDGGSPSISYDRLRFERMYIPMGSSNRENGSYIFINIDKGKPLVTDKQKKWLKENFDKLDRMQKIMVNCWLGDEFPVVESKE